MKQPSARQAIADTARKRTGLAPVAVAFIVVVMVVTLVGATAALGVGFLKPVTAMFEGQFYFIQTILCNLGVPA